MAAIRLGKLFQQTQAVERLWWHIDARDLIVGRIGQKVAKLLLGKHKPIYRPSLDCGDFVVITNVEQVEFSGNKWRQKLYRWHSGYPGGLKEMPAWRMIERRPEQILLKAIKGQMPPNQTRNFLIQSRLKLVVGPENPYKAQCSIGYNFKRHVASEEERPAVQLSSFSDQINQAVLPNREIPRGVPLGKDAVIVPHNSRLLPANASLKRFERGRALYKRGRKSGAAEITLEDEDTAQISIFKPRRSTPRNKTPYISKPKEDYSDLMYIGPESELEFD